jgi:plasmid stabilization system protein ParE
MPQYKIKYVPEALEEIKHIVEHYNSLSAGLGNRFKQHLLAAVKALKNNPNYNSFRYDEVRFAVVDKFPYAAHYTVDGTLVKIQAVLAFKQNPDNNWITRF